MWIRTQENKTTLLMHDIEVRKRNNKFIIKMEKQDEILGVYNTQEEAEKIAKEIQLKDKESYAEKYETLIYAMPKE